MEIFSLIVSQFPAYLYILRARHCVNFLKQNTYMPLARLSRLAGVHTFPIFYFLCLSHQLSKLYGISLWFLSYVNCFILLFFFFGGVFLVDLYLLFKPSSMFCLLGNISGLQLFSRLSRALEAQWRPVFLWAEFFQICVYCPLFSCNIIFLTHKRAEDTNLNEQANLQKVVSPS